MELAEVFDPELLTRVQDLCSMLPDDTRVDARRVVELARVIEQRTHDGSAPHQGAAEDAELKRELQRLVELLSRRSAKAIATAKLGRALLAHLAGDARTRDSVLGECDLQLRGLGL